MVEIPLVDSDIDVSRGRVRIGVAAESRVPSREETARESLPRRQRFAKMEKRVSCTEGLSYSRYVLHIFVIQLSSFLYTTK